MKLSDLKIGTLGGVLPPIDSAIKGAKLSEEWGFDSLWWPDHWMGWHPQSIWKPDIADLPKIQKSSDVYFDVVAAMAATAMVTSRVQLGTSVTDCFRRHPALLAQSWLTLSHISKGRAILGIGAGEVENTEPYGIPFTQPASRLEEVIKIIRLLWENDEPVDYDGKFFKLRGAVLGMRPYEEKYPPIWVAALGPKMLDMAGRLADGWIPMKQEVKTYGEKLATLRRSAQTAGRDPSKITAGMFIQYVIADTHEEAHRMVNAPLAKAYALVEPPSTFERFGVKHPFGDNFYPLTDYIPAKYGRQEVLDAVDKVTSAVAEHTISHGTPEDIAEEIKTYVDQGLEHVLLVNTTAFADLSKVRASFRLTNEVLRLIKSS
ncbi:MAG: LLM class flavin-dependent oxidoreductase [Dehalococcoidia bacterium]|nr:LLM class flavin-dependent oxidoreductase [Dehalococcoidia bacterium]